MAGTPAARIVGVNLSWAELAERTDVWFTALHCTAFHCTVQLCTALHCIALHCTAVHCTAVQRRVSLDTDTCVYQLFGVHRAVSSVTDCSCFTRPYTVHCTLFTVHCTLYTVICKLYSAQCTLYTVQCTLFTVH